MRTPPTIRIDGSIRTALAAFDADRLRWLDEAAALGPIAGLRLGPATAWVLTDLDAAREMLVANGADWTRPPAIRVPLRVGVGDNLFTQAEKAWALLQPQVAPAFRKRALEGRLAGIDELIATEVGAMPLDEDLDLVAAMGRIALVVAARVLLGARLDRPRVDELAAHQQQIVTWVGHRVGKVTSGVPVAWGPSGRAMREHRRALHAFCAALIAGAVARGGADGDDDVLDALVRARPGGKPLGPAQLRGHVLGLLLAGNETTAAALSWTLVHAARNPDEWARVRADPERARPFVDESLRLSPAVWGIPRTPARRGVTVEAGGHTLPVRRGEVVTVYLRAANRDPERWPEPMRFDPDRHLGRDTRSGRALIPFGLGPRGCIGQHLALAEMVAAVRTLACRGDVRVEGVAAEDANFAMRIAGGLRGRLVPARTGAVPPG